MQLYFSSSDSLDRAEVDRYRLQADTDSLYDFMLVSAVNIVCIPLPNIGSNLNQMTVEAIADLLEENSMAAALDMKTMAMAISVVEVLGGASSKLYKN